MLEREHNDAMPFSFLSPCPLPPALPCLLASISPPLSGSWDERAAAMIAWRVPFPSCLPVADLPVSASHRCRLVGRSGERVVFVLCCSVVTICPVFVSLFRLSEARFMSSASCFKELPLSCLPPICLLIIARLVPHLVSHLVGRLVVPALPSMCFSCVFSIHSPASCPRLICPCARLVQSSRHFVSSCVS